MKDKHGNPLGGRDAAPTNQGRSQFLDRNWSTFGQSLDRLSGSPLWSMGMALVFCALATALLTAQEPNADRPAKADTLSFQSVDLDGNGRLTLSEAFCGQKELVVKSTPLYPVHERLFRRADADSDGQLDRDEFDSCPALARAIRAERWVLQTVQPAFETKDGNGDGRISIKEWMTGISADALPLARYEFALCDFDTNGKLALTEYACLPSLWSVDRRGVVPDPIVDEVDRVFARILRGVDSPVRSSVVTAQGSPDSLDAVLQRYALPEASHRDGTLAEREVRWGLEVAYGVRHPSGSWLRRENGEVFDWRTFQSYDENADEALSLDEFTRRYWGGPEKAREIFARADADDDGRLTVPELEQGRLFWLDTFATFGRFDRDRNGWIDRKELSSQAKSWERTYVAMAFPGFDSDGDGRLSFLEFRATPFANPFADWNRRRLDKDGDGRLSLAEFHDRPSPALEGLSAFFFQRLDQDGDGSLSVYELNFQVDWRRVDLQTVFVVLDRNRDRRLSLAEAVGLLPRPAPDTPSARRKYEEKLMKIEDAFRQTDRDGSGDVTPSEFRASKGRLASVVTGRPVLRHPAGARTAPVQGETWNWRLIILVVFNVGLLGGVVWLVWRAVARC